MRASANSPLRAGFTFLEIMLAMAAATVVFLGMYAIQNSANILASKCFAISITGTQARLSLDRIQLLLENATTVPDPVIPINDQGVAQSTSLNISGTGATASGLAPIVSGSSATITGTGNGIKFDRIIGSPYLVTVPAGGISGNAASISFTMDTTAQVPLPVPQPNDILSIYTTAVVTGTSNQVTATLGTISATVTSGTRVTYTVNLTSGLLSGTTVTSITQQKDSLQNVVSPSATLLRPTALVIVYPTTPITNPPATPELRYIDSYVYVAGTKNVDVTKYTSVLTREIQPSVSGTTVLDPNPSAFATVNFQSRPFVSVILHTRSQNYDQYLANKQRKDFSTFMGVGSMISLKSAPN